MVFFGASKKILFSFRRFFISASLAFLILKPVQVFAKSNLEIGAGIAAMDDSDDRYRPAGIFHLGMNDTYQMNVATYGRKFGPFIDRGAVVGIGRRFDPAGNTSNLQAALGMSIMFEQTEYSPSTGDSESKSIGNAGMYFGLSYVIPFKVFYLSFDWDAHLYLAGSSGILLATGRKNFVGLSMGVGI